jgi:hypothetical protein
MAVASLVKLSITLRDRLQAKLDEYFKGEIAVVIRKKRLIAEQRRRQEMAKKLLDDRQTLEARQILTSAGEGDETNSKPSEAA